MVKAHGTNWKYSTGEKRKRTNAVEDFTSSLRLVFAHNEPFHYCIGMRR